MSVRIMSAVWDSAVPAPERFTLLALADRSDEDGVCWPSIPTLAVKCRMGESTIRRHLAALERDGVVTVQHRFNASSLFTINLALLREQAGDTPSQTGGASRSERGSRSDTPSRIGRTPPPDLGGPPSRSEHLSIKDPSEEPSTTSPPAAVAAGENRREKPEPHRDDVEALCTHLRDLMIGNGCKPPTITQEWRRQARLLLDVDGRELSRALNLLDWCQRDEFWASNILSIPTFRKQYDRLALKAREQWRRTNPPRRRGAAGDYQPFRNPADPSVYDEPLLPPNPEEPR